MTWFSYTPSTHKFASKERDAESGLDYFGARYYASTLGRWLSPDWSAVPVPVPYANLTNPQTLNLYAMVRDNPETFADLDGHARELTPDPPTDKCGICGDGTNYDAPQQAQNQQWSLNWPIKASANSSQSSSN